ncbi:hypothetical protein GCM10009590_10430 [Brachybacterium alimentarium]
MDVERTEVLERGVARTLAAGHPPTLGDGTLPPRPMTALCGRGTYLGVRRHGPESATVPPQAPLVHHGHRGPSSVSAGSYGS